MPLRLGLLPYDRLRPAVPGTGQDRLRRELRDHSNLPGGCECATPHQPALRRDPSREHRVPSLAVPSEREMGPSRPVCLVLGALVLTELTVHIRHLRNWFLFRKALGPGGLRGRLEYPRGILLRASA